MYLAFSWIEENKFAASACPMKEDLQQIRDNGIDVIITLTEDPLTHQTNTTEEELLEMGFETLHAPIIDMEAPDKALAQQICQYIDLMLNEDKAVLLHCLGGIGRTGTLLHAYLVHSGNSLEEAKIKIRDLRPMSSWKELTKSQQNFLIDFAK